MISNDSLAAFRAILDKKGFIEDPEDIEPWLHDWRGRYHGTTRAILAPATTAQVAAIVALAAEKSVPLVPQGGNTSMVGGATPPPDGSALILSLRRMNNVRSISARNNLAVCDAGVILSNLHQAAEAIGRRFPLSLGAKGSATVGGLISTNAGGTQVLRHGTMRALVEGIEAVLPDGSIYNGLEALKKDNRGYDIKQLLIGAEGTVGVITGASLRLSPAIADRAVGWACARTPADALAVLQLAESTIGKVVEGFEVLGDETLTAALNLLPGTRCPTATRSEWHILIEVDLEALEGSSARERLETVLSAAFEQGLISDAAIAANEAQAEQFWRLRESLSQAERSLGPALQFDVSVPVASMPDFMIEAGKAAERAFPGTSTSSFGHLGDGNVHFHVRAPQGTDGPSWIAESGPVISAFVHDQVVAAKGSISAEHGIGQMKREDLARLASPAHLHALRSIKTALDPQGIMNPGKLIPLAPGT